MRLTASARRWLGAAVLVVACFAAYLPALRGDFVWDDDTHLLDNPVFEPGGLWRVWTQPPEVINYWPVTWTSYWLEHRLWGFDPLGYHVVNVLIHAASGLLLWVLFDRLGIPLPWLGALLFSVHPVNVESVAWITQRKNVLSLFFFALTLLAYLRFEDRGRRWGSYALALASFGAAMLSKGAAAPLPAVLLLLAWWRRGAIARRDVLAAIPFFLVAGLASLIEVASQTLVSGGTPAIDDTLPARLARAGWIVWFYLSKAVLPVHLSFVYPRWEIDASLVSTWLPSLGLAAGLAAAWRARRGWGRSLLCALLYYLLLLSPVLGFFDVFYMRYSYVADHYQYLALVGIVALLVGTAGSVLSRASVPRGLQLAAATAVVTACTFASAQQSADYRDAETLWRSALARSPDSFLAQYNLGHLLQAQHRLEDAARHYREALRIRPDDALAHNNLGKIALDQGRPVVAIRHYRRALESAPDLLEARNNLAVVLQRQGRLEDAVNEYRTALDLAPDSAEVHYNLALVLERLGRLDEAIEHYRRVLAIDPAADYARASLDRALAARAAQGS